MYMHECMPYIIIIEYQYYTFFLDMSQPSVACLNSLRSAGVGIVGVRSAGVGIAGVRSAGIGRRSREARRRRASMLVFMMPPVYKKWPTPSCHVIILK